MHVTYKSAIAIYGQELMNPTSHELLSQVPAALHTSPLSGIPKVIGKDKLAPFEPVMEIQHNPCLLMF